MAVLFPLILHKNLVKQTPTMGADNIVKQKM